MMKNLLIAILIVGVFLSGGCAKRIEVVTIEKERVDQNLMSGNKGFVMGNHPPDDEPKIRSKTRTIYQVTVELPEYAYRDWNKYKTIDNEVWGNRGYIYGGQKPLRLTPPELEKKARDLPAEDVPIARPIKLPKEKSASSEFIKKSETREVVLPKKEKSVSEPYALKPHVRYVPVVVAP